MAFLTTLPEVVTFTGSTILVWMAIHLHVRSSGPIPHARTLIKINSWLYALASLILLILTCSAPHDDFFPRYAYHLSKFYEFVDIFLVRASGGVIDLHFGFHHLTTPYLTYFRVINDSDAWQVFAALNTFHHVLMYAFFGGASVFRPYLPWTGALQLVVGVVADFAALRNRASGENLFPNVFSICLLSTYFVLSMRELHFTPKNKKVKE